MERSALQVVILFSAITLLGIIGIWARNKVKDHEDMSVAGRTSTASSIFWSTFAFWGGNTIISIIELACNLGVVAIWFGIARWIMFLVILMVCTGPFRSVAMVTLSEFIGRNFKSETLKIITGANIGFNFVFLLVSAIVGAQAFFVTLLGWSTTQAVIFTVISFLIYTTLAGMYGVTYTSKIIAIGQMAALVIAAAWAVHAVGFDNLLKLDKSYYNFLPQKNYSTILMWVYSFLNNAFLAQAAIQIIMSCKTVEEGKRGIKYILAAFIPTIVLSVILGMAAKALYPTIKGIQAAPMVASNIPSPIISTLVVLGLYFTALGWGAPLVLSGGTCFANDVYHAFKKKATSRELVFVMRLGIIFIALVSILFAVALPFGVEYWVIVGFVARNTALFPLILAAMFWKLLSKRWAIVASIAGMIVGFGWYLIKYPKFLFDAHPMFVGMIASMTVLILGTLWEYRGNIALNTSGRVGKWGASLTSISIAVILITIGYAPSLHKIGVFVPFLCIAYNVTFLGVLFLTKPKNEIVDDKKDGLPENVVANQC
jgi:SSS family solute:Na+ symporter